ncbi:MAG: N-6 DNA methylase [Clostridiales bacterium]|nr:N-6 DNA methylase [Clostridiales bacterium]
MNNIAFEISSDLLGILKKKYQDDYSNILDVKLFWHNLNYLLITKVNCKSLSNIEKKVNLDVFEKLGLIPASLRIFAEQNSNLFERNIEVISEKVLSCEQPLDLLRECLLGVELNVRKNTIELKQGKTNRDSTGSYYTPYTLAKAIVWKAFSNPATRKIIQHEANRIKIADLSCGGGEFFCAAQEYFYEELGIPYETSATFFWGIDVDPVVLQITVCKLLLRAKSGDWKKIISHFRVGNPLIQIEAEESFDHKNKLFALNRFYSSEMGMNFSINGFGKFDIILGNPPWEKIRFEERKFFQSYVPEISKLSKKDERTKAIATLECEWHDLFLWSKEISNDYFQINSKKYSHNNIKESVCGELNTYALFTELCYNLLKTNGVSTLVVKNTLATAPAHKKLWSYFLKNKAVVSLHFYENKKKIFNIDSRERFAIISLSKSKNDSFSFATGLEYANDILECDEIDITAKEIKAINPFTQMIPNVAKNGDFRFLLSAHERLPLFEDVYPNCHFGRLVHLTAHSKNISKNSNERNIPIYEGKFIEQYDARFSTFEGMSYDEKYASKASARKNEEIDGIKPLPESRFFIDKTFWNRFIVLYSEKYSLCWRSLTSPTNSRTTIAMILPTCPMCQSIQMLQTKSDVDLLLILGLFNSLPFDYFVRLKMPGIDLTQSVIKQIPVPCATKYEEYAIFNGRNEKLITHILSSVCHLIRKEERLQSLCNSVEHLTYKIDTDTSDENIKKSLDDMFSFAYQIDKTTYLQMLKSFSKR